MRTTLALDSDALDLARKLARRRGLTLGQAVSELVREGAQRPVLTTERHGLTLVRLPPDTPAVSVAEIDRLLEEVP